MRRKRFEKINLKIVALVILVIFFITISVGYSYLQQKLNIYGKSTIAPQNIDEYVVGNSTYSWKIISQETKQNYTCYDVILTIVNLDNDITSWEVAFEMPQGYNNSMSEVEEAAYKNYENERLTIYAKSENGYVSKGNTLKLTMKLTTSGVFNIEKLTLNGKLASSTK